jgi:hypothetical protein
VEKAIAYMQILRNMDYVKQPVIFEKN